MANPVKVQGLDRVNNKVRNRGTVKKVRRLGRDEDGKDGPSLELLLRPWIIIIFAAPSRPRPIHGRCVSHNGRSSELDGTERSLWRMVLRGRVLRIFLGSVLFFVSSFPNSVFWLFEYLFLFTLAPFFPSDGVYPIFKTLFATLSRWSHCVRPENRFRPLLFFWKTASKFCFLFVIEEGYHYLNRVFIVI